MKKFLTFCFLLLSFACVAQATHTCSTCYIDYDNGNDSWNGTSKTFTSGTTGPWKHLPGMLGTGPNGTSSDACTGNCSTQVPVAGDKYILKGGVVWPSSTLPIDWVWSGSSTTTTTIPGYGCSGTGCIYIGKDATWNKGTVVYVITVRDFGGCPQTGVTGTLSAPPSGTTATATPSMIGGLSNFADGSTYNARYWTVTNAGSGYVTNPIVTVAGSGCRSLKAIADITSPVIDEGSPTLTWTVLNGPFNYHSPITFQSQFVIVDGIDIRNMNYSYADVTEQFAQMQVIQAWASVTNMHMHNSAPDPASITHLQSIGEGDSMSQINAAEQTDEVAFNYVENGEATFICPNGISLCGWGDFGNIQGNHIHHNHISYFLWAIKTAGGCNTCGGVPGNNDLFNNEVFDGISQSGSGHLNLFYFGTDGFNNNLYNNLAYDNVGSTNQLTPGVHLTTVFNIDNNVVWNTGSGGSIFQPDFGCCTPDSGIITTFNFRNNKLGSNSSSYANAFKNAAISTGSCTGLQCSQRRLNLYNNAAITDQSGLHWFHMNNAAGQVNGVSSPTDTTADSVNLVASQSTFNTNGENVANGFDPSGSGSFTDPSVFGGTNLNSLCATVPWLCNANALPDSTYTATAQSVTGPWSAGPFFFVSGSPTVVSPTCTPPSGLPPQTVTCSEFTSGAIICFRTDGVDPTAPTPGTCGASTTQYSGAISITVNPTNLKLIGTLSGDVNSSVATYNYSGGTGGKTGIGSGSSIGSKTEVTEQYDPLRGLPSMVGH